VGKTTGCEGWGEERESITASKAETEKAVFGDGDKRKDTSAMRTSS